MKTPGAYDYQDKRRQKISHNKSEKTIFTSEVKRFLTHDNQTPGPGTYAVDPEVGEHSDNAVYETQQKQLQNYKSQSLVRKLPLLPQISSVGNFG